MHIKDSHATALYEDRKKTQLLVVFSTVYTLLQDSSWVTPVFELFIYNSKNSGFFTFPSCEMVVTNLFRSPEHEQEVVTLAALGSSTYIEK